MIKPDDFASWLEHPITKTYLQYLKDLKANREEELLELLNSNIDNPLMLLGNLGGRIYICEALSELTHDMINDFYGLTSEEIENA